MKKANLEAKFPKSSKNFSKLKGKTQNQKLKQKTQGFGKSTWSTCRKSVEKKPALNAVFEVFHCLWANFAIIPTIFSGNIKY